MVKRIRCCAWLTGLMVFLFSLAYSADIPESQRSREVLERVSPRVKTELKEKNLTLGSQVFIRIFKASGELEIWVKKDNRFHLFKTRKICYFSGELGPKLQQGDSQSPEGFYYLKPTSLNPWSRFHLSMNIGYPNAYDRYHSRTGDYLMIHGSCVSIGCYAMTNPGIEEIYTLVHSAFISGQCIIRVHIFPFRMSKEKMETVKDSPWLAFWQNLREGYQYFQENGTPPDVTVTRGRYAFE